MTTVHEPDTDAGAAGRPPGRPAARGTGGTPWLILVVAGGLAAALASGTIRTVAVVAALIAMIMIHELGHFAVAKWSGMKVTEYFLGFGPRLWSFRRGETEYGVKAIPAGGYVRIVGMNNLETVDPADEPRTYRRASFPRRLATVCAGSFMHFVMAFVLLWSLLAIIGRQDDAHPLLQVGSISTLATGPSPAQKAGFHLGDRILAVDGRHLTSWDQLPAYVRDRPGRPVTFTVERDGRRLTLVVTPVDLTRVTVTSGLPAPADGRPTGFVGIGPALPVVRVGPVAAVGRTATEFGSASWQVFGALGHIFSPHGLADYGHNLTGAVSSTSGSAPPSSSASSSAANDRFVSPVGLVRLASDAASSGLRDVVVLLFMINLFIGIFNMLPLLPLDGGHAAVAVYERLRSRRGRQYRVDIRKLMPATYLVFGLIVMIGVSSVYLDIAHPMPNPFQ
ncbi:MAG TPA: RIP metalloprotease [Acidimicrobiales bacterium]|nr:RIP metalloprotease [Acidimicrobiales bacterium]